MLPLHKDPSKIYQRKSRWKILLVLAGMVIIAFSVLVSMYLVKLLAQEEEIKLQQWQSAYEQLNSDKFNPQCDVTLLTQVLANNKTIPVILVNQDGTIDGGNNFGDKLDEDSVYLKKELAMIKRSGQIPIMVNTGYRQIYIYHKQSWLLQLLKWYPVIQFFLVVGFISVGYFLFNRARRAEQNLVWVGLAKETAHQLGTPITAIIGWIENLRDQFNHDPQTLYMLSQLDKDVERLELIADRFSKIGSTPELLPDDIHKALSRSVQYMLPRLPRRVKLVYEPQDQKWDAALNQHLFDWVIENLIRNAVDAMDGVGEIRMSVICTSDQVLIDIQDSGKGIDPAYHKRVFEPGFSTRKRGWGLGLSLAKRIIEKYHSGKIFVAQSIPGNGTTFRIILPAFGQSPTN